MESLIIITASIIGLAVWLYLGWLGERIHRLYYHNHYPILEWAHYDELWARWMMCAGAFNLFSCLVIHRNRHDVSPWPPHAEGAVRQAETDSVNSWFGNPKRFTHN